MLLIIIFLIIPFLSDGKIIALPPIPIDDFEPPLNHQQGNTEIPFSSTFKEHLNYHDRFEYSETDTKHHTHHTEDIFFTDNLFACFNNYYTQIYYIKTCKSNRYKSQENNIKVYYSIKDKKGQV
jgi:hypothetical protein